MCGSGSCVAQGQVNILIKYETWIYITYLTIKFRELWSPVLGVLLVLKMWFGTNWPILLIRFVELVEVFRMLKMYVKGQDGKVKKFGTYGKVFSQGIHMWNMKVLSHLIQKLWPILKFSNGGMHGQMNKLKDFAKSGGQFLLFDTCHHIVNKIYFLLIKSLLKYNYNYILIIYCLKLWDYQNMVARSNVNFNTERKHVNTKSIYFHFVTLSLVKILLLVLTWWNKHQ